MLLETVRRDLYDSGRGVRGTFFAAIAQTMLDTPVDMKTLNLYLRPEHKRMEMLKEIGSLLLLNYKSTSRPMWPGEEAFVAVLDGDTTLQTGDVFLRLGMF